MAYDAKAKPEAEHAGQSAPKLADEAKDRLTDAKAQKAQSKLDIEQCYFFAAPRRNRSVSQTQQTAKPQDADELQTSLAFEVTEDFMTMIIKSFMPKRGRWAERRPGPAAEGTRKTQIEGQAKKEDAKIFDMIDGSNFHGELAKQGIPDGSIGVFAMLIQDPGRGRPIKCLGAPIRELEINLGPDGRIDDRFVVRSTKHCRLKALLPGIALPAKVEKKIKDKPKELCECTWGYWRLWERDDDEYWQHVVMVDGEVVHQAVLKGQGSCELTIGRFGATPDYAWPDGPMIKSLPDLLQHDEMRAAFIENIDLTLGPPIAYPDDGVMNFEDGIYPRMAYPRRPGTGNEIQKIYEPNPLEAAMFEDAELRRRVRRLHFVDFPEQQGKTPPTLGQWLDEMIEAQEKIGTPGYAFWDEFPYEVFQRFRYLGEKNGMVKPVKVGDETLSLQAYNPAKRAQDNQEVLTGTRLAQIGASMFPQTWQLAVDELATIKNFQKKLGDELVVLRQPEQLAKAADTLAKIGGVFGPKLPGGLTASTQ